MSADKRRSGFTLIELLIVVAIIAILAAIAVPNFLEAQTRAKVSRAKADMRTLATATEAYRVDNNGYPIPSNEDGEQIPINIATTEFFETKTSIQLTTPIAYISSRLDEPFPATRGEEDAQFHFGTRAYLVALEGEDEEFREYVFNLLKRKPGAILYYYLSHGPDQDHDGPAHHHHHHNDHDDDDDHDDDHDEGEGGGPALYDPSNGTISNGDIVYFGPGFGFAN